MPDRLSIRSLRHTSEDISVAPLMSIPLLLRERGLDAATVLERIGVEPTVFDDAANRLPFDVAGRLVAECAAVTACPHLGLLLGKRSGASALGVVAGFARHADTVGAGLRMLLAHLHLHDRGGVAALTERSDSAAELSYVIYHPNTPGTAHMMDASAAVMCSIMRELCGPRWAPSEVMLARRRPQRVAPYREFFRAPIRFDAPHTALAFPAECLDRPVYGRDPEARVRLAALAAELSAATPLSATEAVIRALSCMIIAIPPSSGRLAQVLGMKPRRLRERLEAEGTSVKQLLGDVRYELARQLLEETRMPIGEISASLHYSKPGAFSRAFREWSGKTPRRWRQGA